MTGRPEALRVAGRPDRQGGEDLAAAERLIALDDSLAAVVCFHAQQAWPLADLAPLNRYAVEARYPIGDEPISGEEARAAIAVSRRVRVAVLQALGRASPAD